MPEDGRSTGPSVIRLDRRLAVIGGVMSLAGFGVGRTRAQSLDPVRIGITPVVIDSDVVFLDRFSTYFSERLGRPVIIEQRRTYQEITALLLSGQIEAAWICGYPYVQHRDRLRLITSLHREDETDGAILPPLGLPVLGLPPPEIGILDDVAGLQRFTAHDRRPRSVGRGRAGTATLSHRVFRLGRRPDADPAP